MADDYFQKLHKGTQPMRDLFTPKKQAEPKLAAPPKVAKPPEAPGVKVGELQGESPEDWQYMHGEAQERLNKKLYAKSTMPKGSPKGK